MCGLPVIGCILADCQQTEKRLHILFYIMLLIIMEFYYHNVKELSILIFPFYIFEQKGRLKTESCFQTALILFQCVIRDAFAGTESRRGWFANRSATLPSGRYRCRSRRSAAGRIPWRGCSRHRSAWLRRRRHLFAPLAP